MSEANTLASPTQEQFEACLRVLKWMRDGGDLDESWTLPITHICGAVRACLEISKMERDGGRATAMPETASVSTLASVMCSPAPTCRWLALGEMCDAPATHWVKSVKYKHEMPVCEHHADNFRRSEFEITKLENDALCHPADSGRGAQKES